jgi:hypothetical protein
MEASITHRLDRLAALYDALWAERFRRPVIVLYVVAVAATTAILVWPEARLIAVAIASACVVMIAVARVASVSMQQRIRQQIEALDLWTLRYRIDEGALAEASAVGECSLHWHAFAPPREIAGYLVLQRRPVSSGNLIALPLDQLGAEVRSTLEDRVARASAPRMG